MLVANSRSHRPGSDRSLISRWLERFIDAILAGRLTVPSAATFPIEQIRDAVTLQAARHVHGEIVITL